MGGGFSLNVKIFDSTLRDGAQAEGISFSVSDKLKIALALDELGIDYIEAGNPGSNQKDLEFFKEAKSIEFKNSKLVAFGSTRRCNGNVEDDSNVNALLEADTEYVCIFGKSWDFHVESIINTTKEENLNMISDTIKYLKSKNKHVFYDAEHFFDGYKANKEYALETIKAASNAGAECIILCDTNGGTFPDELQDIITEVKKVTSVELGIHAHNDTGMAICVSVMSVFNGCTQVQGTFLGYGERCGNANLSAIIANLELKKGYKCLPIGNISKLTQIARLIAEISNFSLGANLPYVGNNAFAHKAGMHVDGVYKNSKSFEHVSPDLVGNERKFLISEVAGKSTVLAKISKIYPAIKKNDPALTDIISTIKDLEYSGYQFEGADASFELIVHKAFNKFKPYFVVEDFKTIGEGPTFNDKFSASAIIKVSVNGEEEITAANGNGPVDALNTALRKAIGRFYPILNNVSLADYKVRVLDGKESATSAKTRVIIESTDGKYTWSTVGVSKDIIEASFKALIDSIEYKLFKENK
ncbi:MAG: citramalate synthase [Erysipelotrichaceae bacterium]|nr:citramalate synthase [Erysipelotrichaceae bacterium]